MILSMLLICMAIISENTKFGSSQDLLLRLNNAFQNSSNEGRLEINYQGIWGTVCDNNFTHVSARVACASLGFGNMGAAIRNRHGPGTGPIWLSEVICAGTESDIEQCAHRPWGDNNCRHTEDVSISCDCGTRSFSGPTGIISSPNFPTAYANNLHCNSYIKVATGHTVIITFLAFNTQPLTDWLQVTCALGNEFTTPRYSGSDFPAILTISSCRGVNVLFHTDSHAKYAGFSLTYNVTSDTVTGGITTRPSNAFPRSDKYDPIIFNCTTSTKYLPWWSINGEDSYNYTITDSTCGVITSSPYSSWFKTETLGPGSCNLIVVAPVYRLHLLAGSVVCTDSTLSLARAIMIPFKLVLGLTQTRQPYLGPFPTECKLTTAGHEYAGPLDVTRSGRTCQRWDSDQPHYNHFKISNLFPEGNAEAAGNKCRNPDNKHNEGVWCYTTDPSHRWEECDVKLCGCKTTKAGREYAGPLGVTRSGLPCQRWNSDHPHYNNFKNSTLFPEGSAEAAGNKCRNPDGQHTDGVWCYTTDPSRRWEECDVDYCHTDPERRSTRSIDSMAAVTDIIRQKEITISCNPSFIVRHSNTSSIFTYFLYSGGPVVEMRIVGTYWTSLGHFVPSVNTSNTSSYVLVKDPKDGIIPPYTCNIVCNIFTNSSDVAADSAIELSFTTEPVNLTVLFCGIRNFSTPSGQISSPNFPMAYADNQDCYNYISVASGHTVIITFLAFETELNYDNVTITCESGNSFRSPSYSGFELPPLLTISSCSLVNVYFQSDSSVTYKGFSLAYNFTSDIVIGGFTTRPSNAFPRSDKNEPIIFNCTTKSKYLPWWTVNDKLVGNYTITNSACEAIYSSWFKTESLGPGSCNLILILRPNDVCHFVCTDSTLSTARAILVPITLELTTTRSTNSSAIVTDIIRDEELRISCSSSFKFWGSIPSSVFTYFLYNGGPVVQMRILRTYWTSYGYVVSSTDTSDWSHSASYMLIHAPIGVISSFTCNIVFYFFSNISDLSGNSSIHVPFSTEPLDVLYWPTEDKMTIIGHKNGQILHSALLSCSAAANPPTTYTWIDESNGVVTNGPTIIINKSGKYTCNASNIIRGKYYHQSKSIDLQVVEEKSPQNPTVLILLGVAVVTIVIIVAILLIRICRQQERNTAAGVGRDNDRNELELQQKSFKDDHGNALDASESGYDKLDNPKPAGVGRDNDRNELELQQKEHNHRFKDAHGNALDASESGYDKLDNPKRSVPAIPPIYDKLVKRHGKVHKPRKRGENNLYEDGLGKDIDSDDSDYDYPDASQLPTTITSASCDEPEFEK